jgi:hypothetical protein
MTKLIAPPSPSEESVLSQTRKTLSKIRALQGQVPGAKPTPRPTQPRPWIVLSGIGLSLYVQPHLAPVPSFVLRDDEKVWTPRRQENTLVHEDSMWTGTYAWIPLRLIRDLGQEPLEASHDPGTGDWVYRQKFSHFDSHYGFDHLVEIRLDPVTQTYDVLEEYFSL